MNIKVVQAAVDTFGSPNHDKEVFHKQALSLMQNAGIELI